MTNEATPAGGQTSQTGEQGNATTGQQGAQTPATNQAPQELVIRHNGKDVRIPIDRAKELVQKGYNYDSRMAEVNQRAKHLDSYERFMSDMDKSPTLKEAVFRATQNPDLVLRALNGAAAPTPPAGDEGAAQGEGQPAQNRQPDPLASQLQQLTGIVEEVRGHIAQREVNEALEREISKHPWVAGSPSAQKFVRDHVRTQIEADPRNASSVDRLVFEAASNVRDVVAEQNERRLAEAQDRQNLRTTNPGRGQSTLTPAPKLTSKSLDDGTVLQAALKRGREIFGDMFK
jgi:hypothetical protein